MNKKGRVEEKEKKKNCRWKTPRKQTEASFTLDRTLNLAFRAGSRTEW
jgi:hypothetical protein